jgi:branched-subunit amino acid transport protein
VSPYAPGAIWALVLVAGVGTYALRLSFLFLFGRLETVPATVEGVLRFVPGAVFAALVVSTILSLSVDPSVSLVYEPAKLLAGALATLIAWRTGNVLATVGIGMVALWVLKAML